MTSDEESRAFRAALEREIAVVEEARESLRNDSHLRSLCSLAVERLHSFLSHEEADDTARPAKHIAASSQTRFVASNKTGGLAGTLRRTAIDPLHPTG